MKQNLANSIILPPKNGGLKARRERLIRLQRDKDELHHFVIGHTRLLLTIEYDYKLLKKLL